MDQKLDTGTPVGTIGRWNGTSFDPRFTPPQVLPLDLGTTEVFHGDTLIYSGQKYNRWNDDPDITNHHMFDIDLNFPNFLTSNFEPTHSGVVVKNDLISAPGQNGGTIDFKDPWFIDYPDPDYGNNLRNRGMDDNGPDALHFWTRSSPFNPDFTTPYENGQEYLGVFLNQEPDPTNPDVPYYSVRAPQTQTISFHGQNIAWYFQGWEGDEVDFQYPDQIETAVVFHLADAEARALYKGHLASNNSAATAHNNGRRVARDGAGTLHAVYEDNKQVWYTYSTDGGESWAAESLIGGFLSDVGGEDVYPAIAEYDGTLHVAYTEIFYLDEEPVYVEVFHWRKDISDEQWEDYRTIGYMDVSELTFIPKPAIEIWKYSSYEYMVIAFNRVNEPSQIATYYKENGEPNFHSLDDINGSDPSLGANALNDNLYLTCNSGDEIYIRKFNNGLYWGTEQLVSVDPWWLSWNRFSNITHEGAFPSHIVWTSQDDIRNPIVAYRNFKSPANPGQLTYFYSGDINTHPTVAVDETWGKITIFFEEDGNIIRRQKSGDYWTEKTYGAGWYPNIAGHGEYGAIWAKESSAPYRIQSDYTIPESPLEGGDPLAEDTLVINKRLDFTFMQDTTAGHLTLHLENLDAGSRWLQFNRQLHTRQITVPPNAAARFNLRCRFHKLTFPIDTTAVLFKISFDEGNVVRPLGMLRIKDLLTFNNGQYHNIPKTIPMGFLAGKRGQLKLSFGENPPAISDVVVRRDSGEVHVSLGKAGGEGEPMVSTIPAEFRLHQNYPNPFNPTTTISFDLPEDESVNLQIYDITGRKVCTLADQPFSAGVHQVAWDGRDERGAGVSSGIYVYRIEAGKFVESRKMVLMH